MAILAVKTRRLAPSPPGCWGVLRRTSSDLPSHHISLLVPAISGAAADRAAHPALVRRQRGGLDDVHAFLPGAAARGLRLCARHRPATLPGRRAHGALDCGARHSADHAGGKLET